MKKMLVTAALTGALTLTGATTALATEYPSTPSRGGVTTGTTPPGGSVGFNGSGMTPGETVAVSIVCTDGDDSTTTSATVVADAQGNITYTAVMDNPGLCTLTAVGSGSGAIVTAQVTVTGDVTTQAVASSGTQSPANGNGLANTGINPSIALWGAAGIGGLTLGSAVVAVSRRRMKDSATAS